MITYANTLMESETPFNSIIHSLTLIFYLKEKMQREGNITFWDSS